MKVEVSYCATIWENKESLCVPESELEANFEHYRGKLLSNTYRDGFIIISSPNQPEIKVQDELWAIIQNLCFSSIPDLIMHKSVVVRLYNNYGHVRLDPETELVRISGDYISEIKVDSKSLINSLYECGTRFVNLAQKLKEFDPEYEDIIESMQEYADLAKQAIEDPNRYK